MCLAYSLKAKRIERTGSLPLPLAPAFALPSAFYLAIASLAVYPGVVAGGAAHRVPRTALAP